VPLWRPSCSRGASRRSGAMQRHFFFGRRKRPRRHRCWRRGSGEIGEFRASWLSESRWRAERPRRPKAAHNRFSQRELAALVALAGDPFLDGIHSAVQRAAVDVVGRFVLDGHLQGAPPTSPRLQNQPQRPHRPGVATTSSPVSEAPRRPPRRTRRRANCRRSLGGMSPRRLDRTAVEGAGRRGIDEFRCFQCPTGEWPFMQPESGQAGAPPVAVAT
jgi:hypothetical protein